MFVVFLRNDEVDIYCTLAFCYKAQNCSYQNYIKISKAMNMS